MNMSEKENMKEYITTPVSEGEENPTTETKKISEYTGQGGQKGNFYGDALNDSNINDIVEDTLPHVVVLVGFARYGKSTFVSSFYHAVMRTGKIGKYKFLDSDTLLGFERRAHIRREEIKVGKRLDRTPMYADFFLSLLFENTETKNKVKLILSDRSGEDYRDYGKFEAKINDDKSLRYARHIIFFLDAAATASDDYLDMQSDLGMLMPRMSKYGAFNSQKCVDVVFNKKDLVTKVNEADYLTNRSEIVSKIKEATPVNRVVDLKSLQIPMNDECNQFFEYLLDSCEQPEKLNDECMEQQDWVSRLLKV